MLAIFKRHRIDDVDIESPLATERLKIGDVPLPPVPESVIVPAAPAFAGDPIMPLSQVHAGMACTGYSVVQGTTISSFDVEVLEVAGGEATSGGGRILFRVSGPAVDATGIGPGFSGSPIYCPDGAGVSRVIVITFGPMTIAGPHASPANSDPNAGGVQWIHVEDGPMLFQLGSEIRRWPLNTGFVTPLNGQTVHARYNIGDTVQTTLFINSGSSMPASSRPTGAALPSFWHNPPLKGEVASPAVAESYLKDSVVPGRPLPK